MKISILLLFAVICSPIVSLAQTSVLSSEVPSYFESHQYNLGARGVSQSCLTMTNISDSVPCQPALLSDRKKGNFMAQGSFGDSYEALSNANRLLNKDVDQSYVQSLFEKNQTMDMQLNTELTFLAPHFAAQFIPYQVSYFSVVRNKAYPTIGLHALQSRIWNVQGGARLNRNFQVGAELSFLERKFVHAEFDAYDAAAEDGNKLIQPKTQKAVFIEPGVVYTFSNSWRPRLSLVGRNLGFVNEKHDEIDNNPALDAAFGISPPLKWGKLELSTEYHPKKIHQTVIESMTAGISYLFGHMTLMAGGSAEGSLSSGIMFGLDGVRAGIVYTSTKVPFADGDEYVQSIYSQFGFQI